MPAFPASTTVLDSILFRDAFGTPRMREVFSDFSLISRYVEVEIALAKAEARCGVIPVEAAEEIAKRTDVSALDFDQLERFGCFSPHVADKRGLNLCGVVLKAFEQAVQRCRKTG